MGFLADHANAGGWLALLGAGLLLFDRERRQRAWVIGYWAVVNGLFLILHFGRPLFDSIGLRVPQVVTAFHFILFAEGIVMVLAGYAMWRTLETAARVLSKAGPWAKPAVVARLLLVAIVMLSVGRLLPGRLNREDFDESNQRARAFQSRQDDRRLREWIRSSTAPGAVFLGSYRLSLYVIAPAGGKVVALDPVFANPYVDLAIREGDQRTMEDRIAENDRGDTVWRPLDTACSTSFARCSRSPPCRRTRFSRKS